MNVTVRPATAADRSQCMALLETLTGLEATASWNRVFDQLLTTERGAILVADDGEQLVGLATVSYNVAIRYGGEYCQLEELIVDEAARGLNLGGRLVQACLDAARARGCGDMGVYLIPSTEGNRPFYEKYGFEVVGTEMRQSFD